MLLTCPNMGNGEPVELQHASDGVNKIVPAVKEIEMCSKTFTTNICCNLTWQSCLQASEPHGCQNQQRWTLKEPNLSLQLPPPNLFKRT